MTEYMNYLRQEYFKELYDLTENSPEYCIIQGELYDELTGAGRDTDHRLSQRKASDIARLLNREKVEAAEERLAELLEE